MCGINLLYDKSGKVTENLIRKMNRATSYRGPDSAEIKKIKLSGGANLWMGVNRLRIVDNSPLSDQPFSDDSENQWLLYNGEIYNYYDLKNKLIRKGQSFKTGSDTEVLFHFLKKGYLDELRDLNGMFAFVFFDKIKNKMVFARDRWGMKPLYYYSDDNFVIVSSAIKGILSTGLINEKPDVHQIKYYLRYRYTEPGHTLYDRIYQVAPGEVIECSVSGNRLKKLEYVETGIAPYYFPSQKELLTKTEDHIIDSLISHTSSRLPAGLFLSGGVDSTLLLALASHHNIPLAGAFSIVNKKSEKGFGTSDYKYSRMAAKQYRQPLEVVEMEENILDSALEEIEAMDNPVGDSAYLLTRKLSDNASKYTRIVLSGAGADELFAGYNRHQFFYRYLKNPGFYKILSGTLKNFLPLLPSGRDLPFRKRFQLLRKAIFNLDKHPFHTYDNIISFNRLTDWKPDNSWPDFPEKKLVEKYFMLAREKDLNQYLPADVLSLSDQASMKSHLEMRMPYLDLNIMTFIQRIPPWFLIDKGKKWILKEILKKYEGKKYTQRPKEGFGLPVGIWLKKKKFKYLIDEITRHDNLLWEHTDKERIALLVTEHMNDKADNSQEIWSFLTLSLWIKNRFG